MFVNKHTGNIYEQQRANHLLTALLVSIFILYYLLLGYGTDIFLLKNDSLGLIYPATGKIPRATILALFLSGVYTVFVFFRGDNLVLNSVNKMERVWWDDRSYRELIDVVREMSIAAGVSMPSIYIVSDYDPNAFSVGRDPKNASIGVTSGLLQKLDRDELQAVIAHEMAHIRNHDIRLMTLVATLMGGSMLLFAYIQVRWLQSLGFLRRIVFIGGVTAFFLVWVGMVVLAPLVSRLLTLLISHEREYQADATAAEMTRNPVGLLRALEKLDFFAGPTWSISPAIGHLCVVSPMGKYIQAEGQSLFQRLYFKTHPPMIKRIVAMRAMGYIREAKPRHPDKQL